MPRHGGLPGRPARADRLQYWSLKGCDGWGRTQVWYCSPTPSGSQSAFLQSGAGGWREEGRGEIWEKTRDEDISRKSLHFISYVPIINLVTIIINWVTIIINRVTISFYISIATPTSAAAPITLSFTDKIQYKETLKKLKGTCVALNLHHWSFLEVL